MILPRLVLYTTNIFMMFSTNIMFISTIFSRRYYEDNSGPGSCSSGQAWTAPGWAAQPAPGWSPDYSGRRRRGAAGWSWSGKVLGIFCVV
ncbi:unnamed protein product, partial [Amoebophrya sp. A25]|eukprot:GSA25T00006294001.1